MGMYAIAYMFMFSACSTSSVRDTEFTNEGIYCDLPSCFSQVYDSMSVTTDKIATFTKVFPPQKMSDVLERMKSKKISVSKYDGEKTEEAQFLKMSSMNQLVTIEMKIPFKEFPESCNLAYYDKEGNIVAVENMVIVSNDSEENVSLLWDVYPSVDKENAPLGVKASWLALDKAVRIEVIHPDSLYSYQDKAQEYVDNIYTKLVEESKANDDEEANDSSSKNGFKSETPIKEGIFGDIPEMYAQQIHFNCQHEFYPSNLRGEEMDKIVTPEKIEKVRQQLLAKHIHTINDEGLARKEAYIGWVEYKDHYWSVNINVPVVDVTVPIKVEFCDVNGNVLYTSYPTRKPEMETVIVNRGFLSVGAPASEEKRLLEEVEEASKVAQVRIVRANRR